MPCTMIFRRLGAGLLVLALAVSLNAVVATGAKAQSPTATSTPPYWLQFAAAVKSRFEEGISAEDPVAVRFRAYLKAHKGTPGGPPPALTVKAWVKPDGSVERVSFQEFSDAAATKDLQSILTRGKVGLPPPPDMPQPLNLRFSLNIKDKA